MAGMLRGRWASQKTASVGSAGGMEILPRWTAENCAGSFAAPRKTKNTIEPRLRLESNIFAEVTVFLVVWSAVVYKADIDDFVEHLLVFIPGKEVPTGNDKLTGQAILKLPLVTLLWSFSRSLPNCVLVIVLPAPPKSAELRVPWPIPLSQVSSPT